MQSLLQVLNIGTLATWLSISGASTVAVLVPYGEKAAPAQQRDLDLSMGEVVDLDAPAEQGLAGSASPGDVTESSEIIPQEAVIEPVQEVAPLPELAEVAPLPDVPDVDLKVDDLESSQPKPKAVSRKSSSATTTAKPQTAKRGTPGATGTGTGSGNGIAAGSGSSNAGSGRDRISKGKRPTPPYPETCRRNNQEGKVGVTFTIDEKGDVVSVKVTKKSPYPAMDQSAVDGVYRWKFPPGPRASFSQTLSFDLH